MVPIANGTEPIEAVITSDVLRRGGADVTVASSGGSVHVDACWGVKLVVDSLVSDCAVYEFDLIALPVLFFYFCLASYNLHPKEVFFLGFYSSYLV